MKKIFLLLLFSPMANASWVNWPNPKGSADDEATCVAVFGPPCLELPDGDDDIAEVVGLVDGELEVDAGLAQAKQDAENQAKKDAESKLEADKLRLARIAELKALTELGKLTEEEKDEAFRLALTILFEDQKKVEDAKVEAVSAVEAKP